MIGELTLNFLLGLIASFLGGIPFGLVNLAIVYVSVNKNSREAFSIAVGATSVETIFALLSIFIGGLISGFVETYQGIRIFIFIIILTAGLFFIFKKQDTLPSNKHSRFSGFVKGAILMSVSFQVLLLWVVVSAFYKSKNLLDIHMLAVGFFLPGVFVGKMLAYYLYERLGIYIQKNFEKLARNINKIIGYLLLFVSLIYMIKLLIKLLIKLTSYYP